MWKRLLNLSTTMSAIPLVLASGAMLLFAVGYCAHRLWGDNSVVEEITEELLKQDYNISVEFSGR